MSRLARFATALVVIFALAACDGQAAPTGAAATSQASSSVAPSATPGAPGTTAPTNASSDAPTPPTETSGPPSDTPEPGATPGPSASAEPSVDSLKIRRTADCLSDNGSGTVGSIKLTWTATGTSGVRISIDPPSPETAYDYPFADYPASGSAVLPFACNPPNHDSTGDYHLYVVTTLHDKGHYAWRYARVYAVSATPTP